MKGNDPTTNIVVVVVIVGEKREKGELNGVVTVGGSPLPHSPRPFQTHRFPSTRSLTLRGAPAPDSERRRGAVVWSDGVRGGGFGGREDGDGVGGSVQRVDRKNERVVDELISSSVQVPQTLHPNPPSFSSLSRRSLPSLQGPVSRHAPRRSPS